MKLSTVGFLYSIAVLFFVLAGRYWMVVREQGLIQYNFCAFSTYQLPTANEWSKILHEHASEIKDGRSDSGSLNGSYIGGWNRCFISFVNDRSWNYFEIKASKPYLLGGNMTDTDRIAGNVGWRAATNVLEAQLLFKSVQATKSAICYYHPHLWLAIAFFFIAFSVLVYGLYAQRYCCGRERRGSPPHVRT